MLNREIHSGIGSKNHAGNIIQLPDNPSLQSIMRIPANNFICQFASFTSLDIPLYHLFLCFMKSIKECGLWIDTIVSDCHVLAFILNSSRENAKSSVTVSLSNVIDLRHSPLT